MFAGRQRQHLVAAVARPAVDFCTRRGCRAERRDDMHMRTWKLVVVGISAMAGFGPAASALAGGEGKEAGFVEREMKMMDTNGDNQVSVEEHATGSRTMFARMDADKDGKVTAVEMAAGHERVTGEKATGEKAQKAQMKASEKIKTCDTDNDGAMTETEHTSCARMMFGRMDTDKDGQLSRTELTSGHSKMLHKGEKPQQEAPK
jgi:EF hand